MHEVQRLVQGFRQAAGLDVRVTPHSFRHGFAAQLASRVSLRVIQCLLGHRFPGVNRSEPLDRGATLCCDRRGRGQAEHPGRPPSATWTAGDPLRILRPRKSSLLEVIRPERARRPRRTLTAERLHTGRAPARAALRTADTEDLGRLSPPGRWGGKAAAAASDER